MSDLNQSNVFFPREVDPLLFDFSDPAQAGRHHDVLRRMLRRIAEVVREMIGPFPPFGEYPVFRPRVLYQGDFVPKPCFQIGKPTDGHQQPRDTHSDEFLFWGHWIDVWIFQRKRDERSHVPSKAMKLYGNSFVGKPARDSELAQFLLAPMRTTYCSAFSKGVARETRRLFAHSILLDSAKIDAELISYKLDDVLEFLRARLKPPLAPKAQEDVKKIQQHLHGWQRRYAAWVLHDTEAVLAASVSHLLKLQHRKDKGWSLRDHAKLAGSSPLNTAEVVAALLVSDRPEVASPVEGATGFLLEKLQPDGCWTTSSRQEPVESRIANAFACYCLVRILGAEHERLRKAIPRLAHCLTSLDPETSPVTLGVISHGIRALAPALKSELWRDLLKPIIRAVAERLIDFERRGWERFAARQQKYSSTVLAGAQTLLALTALDLEGGMDYGPERDAIHQQLLSFPQRPTPNYFTDTDPETGSEFSHWVRAWLAAALASQPSTNSMNLVCVARDLIAGFDPRRGAIIAPDFPYFTWAEAHFIFALSLVLKHLRRSILEEISDD